MQKNDKKHSIFMQEQNKYKQLISELFVQCNSIEGALGELPPQEVAVKRIEIAHLSVFSATLNLQIFNMAVQLVGARNDEFLVDARKSIVRALSAIEAVVTGYVDVSFAELEEKTALISFMTFQMRYDLICKLGLAIDLVQSNFSRDSRVYWSFVEILGRFAAVSKNLVNWQETTKALFNPGDPCYAIAVRYVALLKRIFPAAIEGYNEKFDFLTHFSEDLRQAEFFGNAYIQILQAIGDSACIDAARERVRFLHNKYQSNYEREMENKKQKQ